MFKLVSLILSRSCELDFCLLIGEPASPWTLPKAFTTCTATISCTWISSLLISCWLQTIRPKLQMLAYRVSSQHNLCLLPWSVTLQMAIQVTSVHTARCSIYCDAWLCDSICLTSRRVYCKHVQQQLKMLTAPAVLTRMHSVDRAYHVHFGLYYALEQLGIARSAWAQSAP